MKPYYEQDGITIYHGDCRDISEWLRVDVVVSDPPYGIGWKKGLNRAAGSRAHTGIPNDSDTSVRDEMLRMCEGKPVIIFGSFYAPFPVNLKQVLVWHKPNDAGVVGSTTGYRRDAEPIFLVGMWPTKACAWSSVLRSGYSGIASIAAATGHPHTKPVDLLINLIDRCPSGSVADPFMGSGSTLVAAKRLGRMAIGIDVEERSCEIAAKRMAQGALDLFSTAVGA